MAELWGTAGGAVGCRAASESIGEFFSGLIAMGLDSGDGLVNLLLPSEDPREGMLMSFASCLAAAVAWRAVGAGSVKGASRLDCIHFPLVPLLIPDYDMAR